MKSRIAPSGMPSGSIDLYNHDTNPGGLSVFAPPYGFEGSPDDYYAIMRHRYSRCIGCKQQMALVALMLDEASSKIEFTGFWSVQAKKVADKILKTQKEKRRNRAY